MRVSQGVLAVILLVDVIIIVSVPRLRAEESAPGVASVVWATLIAAFCVFTDRIVAWGKREEEERLTGRPETRRTLKEWLAVLASTIILVVFILITVLMTATLILRSLDAGLALDGDRYAVDGGKYEVHFACYGNSTTDKKGRRTPTVLLEAAEDPVEYSLEHWAYSAVKNGTIDRYCYWDRPGYAWSDNAPSPHSAGMSAENLAEVLAITGEEGPWILVSAGYGSLVSRIFSARNFREVAGIMMIDPMHEDLLHRIASPYRGFMLWAWGIISPLGIRRIIGSLFMGQTKEDRVFGRDNSQGGKKIKVRVSHVEHYRNHTNIPSVGYAPGEPRRYLFHQERGCHCTYHPGCRHAARGCLLWSPRQDRQRMGRQAERFDQHHWQAHQLGCRPQGTPLRLGHS